MNWIDIVYHLCLIIIPAGLVLLTAIHFFRKEQALAALKFHQEIRAKKVDILLPNQIEAYQRALLLMERIHPNNLVMRTITPGVPAHLFQAELLKSIREEFDHNVAQQLFISPQAWKVVEQAKNETVKIIHVAGNSLTDTSVSTDLATRIFEMVAEIGDMPTDIALNALKEDIQKLFHN